VVEPQTLSRERPYLAHTLALTRRAYGLDRVADVPVPANAAISNGELRTNRDVPDRFPARQLPSCCPTPPLAGRYFVVSCFCDSVTPSIWMRRGFTLSLIGRVSSSIPWRCVALIRSRSRNCGTVIVCS